MKMHFDRQAIRLGFALYFGTLATPAFPQSSTVSRLTLQGPAEQAGDLVVRDALGRPCLDIEAAARAHIVNPDIVDHVVSLKNNCAKLIKAKVCYFHSDRCNRVEIQPYKRADTVLGTMQVKFFRYSVLQK